MDPTEEDRLPWRQLFDRAAGPMAVLDGQGRYLWANDALCGLLGYTADQLRRRSFRELTHPGDRHLDRELIEDLLAGRVGRVVMEKRYVRADGS